MMGDAMSSVEAIAAADTAAKAALSTEQQTLLTQYEALSEEQKKNASAEMKGAYDAYMTAYTGELSKLESQMKDGSYAVAAAGALAATAAFLF